MKSRLLRSIALAAIALLPAACGSEEAKEAAATSNWPAAQSPNLQSAAIETRVQQILERMTLEEKVGQIMQVEIQHISPEEVRQFHIGSVLNGGGSLPNRNKYATPAEWLAMADAFYTASMDTSDGGEAIPIIWGSDAVHGHNNVIGATLFPHNIGLGAANNPALLREIGRITALEMRATGIDWTFAPTLAVAQNDRWGRTYESYSEDPDIVRDYAREMVIGLQGDPSSNSFLDIDHVVATAKHFVGDGGTVGGDDQGDALMPEAELRDIHAAGYYGALGSGVQTAMASFSSWNGEKMHGSKYMLTTILKESLGFDGLIVGDWNGHGQVPGCTNASCPIAVNAGLDLFMTIAEWRELYANTLAQVQSGEIPTTRLDDAVSRILRVKLRAGLFDKGMPSVRGVAGRDGIIGQPAHREVARQAVRESLVLLKNSDNILPLSPGSTVLVTGDGADNIGKQSGGWTISWQGTGNVNSDFPGATSIYEGIRQAVDAAGGAAILSPDGAFETKPDVAIIVFGEEPYAEGQGDIDTLEFEPGAKKSLKLLRSLSNAGVKTVAVFLSGRPLWVNPEINASDAFVAAWLPGSEGAGVADVLFSAPDGQVAHDFKGRLSFSWPNTPLQDKLNPHHEGYAPLFAFGYGLDYATAAEGPDSLAEDVEGVRGEGLASLRLFYGRTAAPWRAFIDDGTTDQVISGSYAALPSNFATAVLIDKDIQGDAVRVSWSGEGAAAFLVGDAPAVDWSDFFESGASLQFDLLAAGGIPNEARLSLGCGDDCRMGFSLSGVADAADGQDWQRISVPFVCFSEDISDFREIDAPFRVDVSSAAELAFANITVVPGNGEAATDCPN